MSYQSSTEALCVQARRALQRAASMADHDFATRPASGREADVDAERVLEELVHILELTTAVATTIYDATGAGATRGLASPEQPDVVAPAPVERVGEPGAALLQQLVARRTSSP